MTRKTRLHSAIQALRILTVVALLSIALLYQLGLVDLTSDYELVDTYDPERRLYTDERAPYTGDVWREATPAGDNAQ